MVERFATEHGRRPALLIVAPDTALAMDEPMVEHDLRRLAAKTGMAVMLAGGRKA
jgi:hypothetical protein